MLQAGVENDFPNSFQAPVTDACRPRLTYQGDPGQDLAARRPQDFCELASSGSAPTMVQAGKHAPPAQADPAPWTLQPPVRSPGWLFWSLLRRRRRIASCVRTQGCRPTPPGGAVGAFPGVARGSDVGQLMAERVFGLGIAQPRREANEVFSREGPSQGSGHSPGPLQPRR